MQVANIETLRCALEVVQEDERIVWSCEHGSVAYERRSEAIWNGPLVHWTGSSSVCREVVRSTVEAMLDSGLEAVEVSPDDVDGWDPERLGFERAWARRKPGVWRFDAGCWFGGTELALQGLVVSLSGGGLRAVAYALGVFDGLERLGLLERVRCVTAVSGGAILAGAWTGARARDLSHAAFRQATLDFLVGTPQGRIAVGSPSLIRRYADLLSQRLVGEPEGRPLTLGSVPQEPEVVFQTTELTRAGSFVLAVGERVTQGSPGKLRLPREHMARVRLADAMAASAAYPVGFEPFVFPRDFDLPHEVERTLASTIQQARERGTWPGSGIDAVPLVDGGVFDNQGVHAALNAAARHRADADLLLVADAAITEPGRAVWVPGQLEGDASVLMGLVAGVAVLLVVGWALVTLLPPWSVVLTVFALVALLIGLGPSVVIDRLRRDLPPDLPVSGFRTPTGFIHATGLRLQIAVVLLRDVFLERIRSLRYSQVFDRERHVVPAFARIQDLTRIAEAGEGTILGALRQRHPLAPADLARAERAARVPTVLHLSGTTTERRQVLEDVVRVGELTVYWKLLLLCHTSDRPRSRALRALQVQLEQAVDQAAAESGEPSAG